MYIRIIIQKLKTNNMVITILLSILIIILLASLKLTVLISIIEKVVDYKLKEINKNNKDLSD